jgi:hypothetical protein
MTNKGVMREREREEGIQGERMKNEDWVMKKKIWNNVRIYEILWEYLCSRELRK